MPTLQSADYQQAIDAIIDDYAVELRGMLADLKKGGLTPDDVSMMGLNERLHAITGFDAQFIGTTRNAMKQLLEQS